MQSPDARGGDRSLPLTEGSGLVVGTETGMFVKWWDGGTFREQWKGRAGIGQKNSELCEPQRRAEGGQHDEPQSSSHSTGGERPERVKYSFCCTIILLIQEPLPFFSLLFFPSPFCIPLMGWVFPRSLACLPAFTPLLHPHYHLHCKLK